MYTKKILTMVIAGYFLTVNYEAYAQGYGALGGGAGGAAEAANVSFEAGAVSTNPDSHNQLFAADLGFIFNARYIIRYLIIITPVWVIDKKVMNTQ
jgi:hypothetical protein